ncbi:MAG: TetR/AcrR family transcriptional regulator [Verrucomicrobia bacterium]|nr:TetR/AcrR family transcriptional regulator [Verrucomicrobiota bacterium]
MTTSPSRVPASERRQQILAVATDLFARQGFHGTTTRQIADKVGVKEIILFRLFPTKHDLYWAVIEATMQAGQCGHNVKELLASGMDDATLFRTLATNLLDRNEYDLALTRLLFFSALEAHELSQRFAQTYVAAFYETVTNYIRKRIRDGAFRQVDPFFAARAFFGMVFQYSLACQLFGVKPEPKKAAATFTDIWLKGIQR